MKLEDAVAVLDAFHIAKLGTAAVDECRRRVQQETLGHSGRNGDPRYGIQNLRSGAEAHRQAVDQARDRDRRQTG